MPQSLLPHHTAGHAGGGLRPAYALHNCLSQVGLPSNFPPESPLLYEMIQAIQEQKMEPLRSLKMAP